MSNEIFFIGHVLVNIFFLLLSLRLGKHYLIIFYTLQIVMANFFVLKEITLFSLDVTASDVFAVGSLLSINLLREYFGLETAKKTIWLGFFSSLIFTVMGQLHLRYIPNLFDKTSGAYHEILSLNLRVSLASFITFLIVQKLDLELFKLLKKRFERSLAFTLFLTITISNAIDTVLFSFLGLYGLVQSIVPIMFMAYLIKIIITTASSPFIGLTKKLVKDNVI